MKKTLAAIAMTGLFLATVAAAGDPVSDERVLARWRGGRMTEPEFIEVLDHDGEALRRGGEYLEKQVCKAAFQVIYGERAVDLGIDSSEPFLVTLEDWRRNRLELEYIRLHQPPPAELVSEADARESYRENLDRLYTSSGSTDISVLFIRCGEDPGVREQCLEKLAVYQNRVTMLPSEFAVVISEERATSGEANGSFDEVPLNHLAPDLRAAVLTTPPGFFTPVIETPVGLFWAQVDARVDPEAIPFDRAEAHVRRVLELEVAAEWRAKEARRVRVELSLPASTSDQGCFAAAAVAEGLDQDGSFKAAERSFIQWKLADLAFLADVEILPGDAEIAARVARPEMDRRYRRYDVELLIVKVGADRYGAIAKAEELRRAAAGGAVERAADWNEVDRVILTAVSADGLARISKRMAESVVQGGDGWSSEPFAFPRGITIPGEVTEATEDLVFPGCIVLAIRRSSRMASVGEVRSEAHRAFRNEITTVDRFTEVFGARWGFELLVGSEGIEPVAEDAAEEGDVR